MKAYANYLSILIFFFLRNNFMYFFCCIFFVFFFFPLGLAVLSRYLGMGIIAVVFCLIVFLFCFVLWLFERVKLDKVFLCQGTPTSCVCFWGWGEYLHHSCLPSPLAIMDKLILELKFCLHDSCGGGKKKKHITMKATKSVPIDTSTF